jgi:monovalent cation/hydrogen antiporter
VIVGWTGMRGVIALAAAIALPATLATGEPFPQRELIVFLSFSVIFVTLVLQGLTLPAVVRALGVADGDRNQHEQEERLARREILDAALAYLAKTRTEDDNDFQEIYDDLTVHYRHRLAALGDDDSADSRLSPGHRERHPRLLRDLIRIERQTAVRLRNQGRINDETLREIEYELDLREANRSIVA